MNIPAVRRILLRFERAANKNQDQRSKYPDDPTKYAFQCTHKCTVCINRPVIRFIDSEADLDLALKALLPLAQAPIIAYPELVKSGALTRLIGLLSHENADIVIDVVEVINELTDEDVGNEQEEDEEEEGSRAEALKSLIEGLVGLYTLAPFSRRTQLRLRQLENSILELLVDNDLKP